MIIKILVFVHYQQRPIYFEEQITKVFEFLKDLNINEN
jgi:hypothetical protein